MKKIVYRRPDGGLSILHPVYPIIIEVEGEAPKQLEEEDALLYLINKDVPAGSTEIEIVEEEDIPTDRTFRDAWDKNAGKVVVDMAAAKEIHLERLRDQRNEKLKSLDVEYIKALEVDDNKKMLDIASEKTALRDLPISAASDMKNIHTPEELKNYKPEILTSVAKAEDIKEKP